MSVLGIVFVSAVAVAILYCVFMIGYHSGSIACSRKFLLGIHEIEDHHRAFVARVHKILDGAPK